MITPEEARAELARRASAKQQNITPEQARIELQKRNSVRDNAEQIEPGIYGETNPPEQKLLQNLVALGSGMEIGRAIPEGIANLVKSKLGKAILNSPKSLGKQYAAQDAAVGVKRVLPETGPKAVFEDPYKYPSNLSKPKYASVETPGPKIVNTRGEIISPNPESSIQAVDTAPTSFTRPKPTIQAEPMPTSIPEKLPDNLAGFKKFAESRIDKFGDKLTPQELMNYKVHLETKMADGSIPKFGDNGKITTAWQQASDLRNKVASTFKTVMDKKLQNVDLPSGVERTRTNLDSINTLSNSIRNKGRAVGDFAKKAGKVAAWSTLAGALGGNAYKYFK